MNWKNIAAKRGQIEIEGETQFVRGLMQRELFQVGEAEKQADGDFVASRQMIFFGCIENDGRQTFSAPSDMPTDIPMHVAISLISEIKRLSGIGDVEKKA